MSAGPLSVLRVSSRTPSGTSGGEVIVPPPRPSSRRPRDLVTDHYEIRVCRGCPNALVDVEGTAGMIAHVVERSGWSDVLERRLNGRPARLHEKFRAAVAGCPNACSEPQIRDFGVLGQAAPERREAGCTQCGACVVACREAAVLVEEEPHIRDDRCVNCGACAAACPTGALCVGRRGYRVMGGGNLGRHPRFADTIFALTDEVGVKAAARVGIEFLVDHEGERLGDVLRRETPRRFRTWAESLRRALPPLAERTKLANRPVLSESFSSNEKRIPFQGTAPRGADA